MRLFIPLMLLMAALTGFSGCLMLGKMNPVKSYFVTDQEREQLIQVLKPLGMGYGFDIDLRMDYAFYMNEERKSSLTDARLRTALGGMSSSQIKKLYENVYALYIISDVKVREYKYIEYWHDYTTVKKYYYPACADLYKVFDRVFSGMNIVPAAELQAFKKKLDKEIRHKYWVKKFEDI